MSTWVTLTENDVLSGMAKKERDDFAKASVGETVTDRLIPIIANFSNEIRGYVQTHAPGAVSATPGTIPPEFVDRAVDYIRFKLLITISGYQPGDARTKAYEKAEAYFLSVAKGSIVPAKADDAQAPAIAETRKAASPRIKARKPKFSRDQQDGI